VWAAAIQTSTDPLFVAPGAIPWLLLQVLGSQEGPAGGDKLTPTLYIQARAHVRRRDAGDRMRRDHRHRQEGRWCPTKRTTSSTSSVATATTTDTHLTSYPKL
jgi:hypothetical protein